MSHQTDWETAGITRSDGSLDRPLAGPRLAVPAHVDVDESGENLIWDWGSKRPPATRRPDRGMLDGFVLLADTPVERIVDYARRWGVLSLIAYPGEPEFQRTEPIKRWRAWSRAAQAALNIAAAADSSRRASDEDWDAIQLPVSRGQDDPEPPRRSPPRGRGPSREYRRELARFLNRWLNVADIDLSLVWDDEDPKIEFEAGLLGALGIQVMQAIVRSEGLYFCASCGRAYAPTRLPRADQRSFCTTCGTKAARRFATSDYRRRERAKRARRKGGTR